MLKVYERVVRALNFEEPDRVPIWDKLNNEALFKKFGGQGDPLIVASKTHKALGIDATRRLHPLPYNEKNKHWLDLKIESWFKFLDVPREGWKTQFDITQTTKFIKSRPFTTIEELEANLPRYPIEDEVVQWYLDEFKKYHNILWPHTIFIGAIEGCLTEAYTFTGLQLFSKIIYLAPNILKYLLDLFTKFITIITKIYAEFELGPAFMICDDIAHRDGLMFPPSFLKNEFLPRLKTIMQPLKKKNIKVLFHSDGNLNRILDDLVEAGIDGLNPIEPVAGMDIAEIKEKYGDKLILIGNIDCTQLLSHGTSKEIIKATIDCINAAAPGSGFFIGSSSEIHSGIPVENAVLMYETAKKYGRYFI
ncbi:MAG: uroporphyrinogen decarboxylase family protein [Nitrososphaeria archaeon]